MRGPLLLRLPALALALAAPASAAVDPANPSCPAKLDWSNNPQMHFSLREEGGRKILLAEGVIDEDVAARLKDALDRHKPVDEIRFRSPGGNAKAGNEAGLVIRKSGIPTRIPAGWACFSACNFMFMGGPIRSVEPGGQFIVHMFTHTADRTLIAEETAKGTDSAVGLIAEIEQGSAMLASEDNDFLIRMGVSRKLLTEVMYRQKAIEDASDRSTRRCLTQDEIHRYNVANLR